MGNTHPTPKPNPLSYFGEIGLYPGKKDLFVNQIQKLSAEFATRFQDFKTH